MKFRQIATLIAIRFAFIFWLLFALTFNGGAIPILSFLQGVIVSALQVIVKWYASNMIYLTEPLTVVTSGSGDTTFHYILLLCICSTSVLGTLVWSVADHKRKSHDQLFYWLTVVIRFYVGFMLLHYGLAKLNNGQFPSLSSYRLLSTYGDSSPMGLAWSFLSFSDGYKWFMFFAELMGVLLFFRRTATIGAFLCLITSINIMAINYFFDVPVKILSTALGLMCLTLLSPNIIQLFRFFFKGEMVQLNLLEAPALKKKGLRISKLVLKYAVLLLFAGLPLFMSLKMAWFDAKTNDDQAVSGIFEIEDVTWLKQDPTADSSSLRPKWTVLTFEANSYGSVRSVNDKTEVYKYKLDNHAKSVQITFVDAPDVSHRLDYTVASQDRMVLKGDYFGAPATVILKRKTFELTERKFQWISEYPHNR